MKKNKKGFTLIELLAVIVILGLLLAIAIPSITKYITESRRKTIVSSIDGYISSVVIDVNDGKYGFAKENKIFAVPIECVSLEKGGKSPFGYWSPASDEYWSYVLVQYNSEKHTYTYGFTFKDSAGFGIYPTSQDIINPKDSNQIKTGLNLTKPVSGLALNMGSVDVWNGFSVNANTEVVVLDSDTCSISVKKPCTGEGSKKGDVVTCGSEKFYIIEDNTSTITLLTALPINVDVNNPVQNASASTTYFSNGSYWARQTGPSTYYLKEEYDDGSQYPYVFDKNADNSYKYVDAYEKYLNGQGVTSARAKLISLEQLTALGCGGGTCSSQYTSILGNGYDWISGSMSSLGGGIWGINSSSSGNVVVKAYSKNSSIKIRPTVVVSKSEIKFN